MKCPNCTFKNRDRAHYCRKCGQSLNIISMTATNSEALESASHSSAIGSGLRKGGRSVEISNLRLSQDDKEMFGRFTEQLQQVMNFAEQVARRLRLNSIDTDHILLGLLNKDETFT